MFDALLRLQGHDTTADQLRHRRETLPQRAALADLRRAAIAQEAKAAQLRDRREELATAQRRLEHDTGLVVDKAAEENERLYSGSVTSPRELQAIQQEIEALARRQRQLEDGVIELMEQIEPVDAEIGELAADGDRVEAEVAVATAELAEAEKEIDAELEALEVEITRERADIAPDLLATYDNMRKQLGGIAVARLVGGSCGGCHLTLSAVELDRIRHEPPDAKILCEECGRLLVR